MMSSQEQGPPHELQPKAYSNPKASEKHTPLRTRPGGDRQTKHQREDSDANHWVKGNFRIGLEGQEKCGELEAPREQYPPAHHKLPQ